MLKIGWAVRDIVPDKPVMLQGQMHVRVSKAVADPVTVTALALESEIGAVIFLACDLAHITTALLEATRKRLSEKLPDFDASLLIMHATHTHTSLTFTDGIYRMPDGVDCMTPDEAFAFITECATDAAVQAWTERAPGAVCRGFGHAVVGHNRRASYLDGSALMYGNTDTTSFSHIEGYEDHGLDLLFTFDADKRLTGVVVNLACPSQETEGDYTISADFWHEVRVELRRRLGEGLFVLPQCAPAGDQSPHLLVHKKEESYMLGLRGLTRRQEIARRIANAVEDVYSVVKHTAMVNPPLFHRIETLELPGRIITEEDYKYAENELRTVLGQDPKISWAQRRLRRMIAEYESGEKKPPFKMELHVVRLGDIVFATNPFELYLDYGIRIKARSKAEQTFLVQLACGTGMYLPSAKAVAKHYGGLAADNYVGPEGGQLLVERTLELIAELFTEK